MYNEAMSVDDNYWHYNEFRGCKMLPVFNAGGQLGGQVKVKIQDMVTLNHRNGHLHMWVSYYIKKRYGLNVHLDSKVDEIGTLQHKRTC